MKNNGELTDVFDYEGRLLFSYDQNLGYIDNDSQFLYVYKDGRVNKMYDFDGNLIDEGNLSQVYNHEQTDVYYMKDNSLLNQNKEVIYTSKKIKTNKTYSYNIYHNFLYSYGLKENILVDIRTESV